MDIQKIRMDTPCENIYLDHAGASIPPKPVIEAVEDYFQNAVKYGPKTEWMMSGCWKKFGQARKSIASLIGAKDIEIAITVNGSDAISLVANGLSLKPGDNVIVDGLTNISNIAPWLRLKQSIGIEVKMARAIKPGFIDLENLEELIDDRTKVISLTHMPNNLGTVQPAEEVGNIARRKGVLYLLDAANTVGVVDINVNKIGCDFMAVSGRKYLRGPTGTGFLYIRERHIPSVKQPYVGWKSGNWDWENGTYQDAETIDRFVSGEPNFPGIFGLGRAVDYIREIGGMASIEKRVKELTDYLLNKLEAISGLEYYGPNSSEGRCGLVTFNIKGITAEELGHLLNQKGIIVQAGDFYLPGPLKMYGIDSVVRIALHYCNTKEEIDRVITILKEISDAKVE